MQGDFVQGGLIEDTSIKSPLDILKAIAKSGDATESMECKNDNCAKVKRKVKISNECPMVCVYDKNKNVVLECGKSWQVD